MIKVLFLFAVVYFASSFVFQFFYPVPGIDGREASVAIPASEDTNLGALILNLAGENEGKSGVAPLIHGPDAFAARVVLAEAAQASIDARYYIWQKDLTGLMLLDKLRQAADRGVRVRLLLDDNGIPDLDPELAEVNAHPNIDVRIFNPFVLRSPRIVSYMLDFSRLNRRMHNKSMSFDGVAAIVGGRNIGDIYFYRNDEVNYFDFDVAVIGEAARVVDEDFDKYWASEAAVPLEALIAGADPDGSALNKSLELARTGPGVLAYEKSITESQILSQLTDNARGFEWAETTLVSDDPAKVQGLMDESGYLYSRIQSIVTPPEEQVDLISAYFVPGPRIRQLLSTWASDGVIVRTLTNAQEATDVLPVHGAYRKYREELAEAGVRIYELKSLQELPTLTEQFGLVGSKNSSLHAKTFVIDRSEIFVGSYNFDARSAFLNTEMGFLIKSPLLASAVSSALDERLDDWAYEVDLSDEGDLTWTDKSVKEKVSTYTTEPNTTTFTRALAALFGFLPIEWML